MACNTLSASSTSVAPFFDTDTRTFGPDSSIDSTRVPTRTSMPSFL